MSDLASKKTEAPYLGGGPGSILRSQGMQRGEGKCGKYVQDLKVWPTCTPTAAWLFISEGC